MKAVEQEAGARLADQMAAELSSRYGSVAGGRLVTIREAARYLDLTPRRCRDLFKGKLVDLGEQSLRVRWCDVEQLIRERTR